MLKIGGGRFRGRRIESPPGKATRPTSGRLKKALFDILAPYLLEAHVLDLCAGAGALGLEALSRGASRVTFVERGRAASMAIESNLRRLGVAAQAEVLRCEVRSALNQLAQSGTRFDIVLLDPPYKSNDPGAVLSKLGQLPILASDGVAVLEHHHKLDLDETYRALRKSRQVRAGESCLTFYKLAD